MKNPLASRSRLRPPKLRRLLECFVNDLSATQCSSMCGVSRITVNRYYMGLRRHLLSCSPPAEFVSGHAEVDESYFGPRFSSGRRGRGSGNKRIAFGILDRGGSVACCEVKKVNRSTLIPIIEKTVPKGSVIHTDEFRSYSCLSKLGYDHRSICHSKGEYARYSDCLRTTNGIESFWSFCKRRLSKFCGISKEHFPLHLSECQWRFNHRKLSKGEILKALVSSLKKNPLFKALSKASKPLRKPPSRFSFPPPKPSIFSRFLGLFPRLLPLRL